MTELLEVGMGCLTLIVLAGCALGNAVHKREIAETRRLDAAERLAAEEADEEPEESDAIYDDLLETRENYEGHLARSQTSSERKSWNERIVSIDSKIEARLREREKAKAGE